ncbi:MAG: hypothetical protein R3C16_01620 [Hyphomonadaceae bacterium]
MGALKNACQESGDAALASLAGVELQHDLHLSIPDWTAWESISNRVAAIGADVHALQLAAQGDGGFQVRCRLKKVSAQMARALLGDLLDEGLAAQGKIEHLMLVKHGTGAGR